MSIVLLYREFHFPGRHFVAHYDSLSFVTNEQSIGHTSRFPKNLGNVLISSNIVNEPIHQKIGEFLADFHSSRLGGIFSMRGVSVQNSNVKRDKGNPK